MPTRRMDRTQRAAAPSVPATDNRAQPGKPVEKAPEAGLVPPWTLLATARHAALQMEVAYRLLIKLGPQRTHPELAPTVDYHLANFRAAQAAFRRSQELLMSDMTPAAQALKEDLFELVMRATSHAVLLQRSGFAV